MRLSILPFLTALLSANVATASDNELSFEAMSWLTGCWKGTGLGGQVEECWLQSDDNRLTGVFQLTKDGKQQFSEIVMIADFDGETGMRVKHFDASFNQWESDQQTGHTFPLVSIDTYSIQFEGLRYELINDVCHVTLNMRTGDAISKVQFVLNRN